MRMIWAWAIVGLYVAYTWIYFHGLDGADNYYWVNKDFFLYETLVALGAISALALLFSWTIGGVRLRIEVGARFGHSGKPSSSPSCSCPTRRYWLSSPS